MIFKKISIQNFMSIRDIKLNLDNQGLTLIQGKNCDNDSLNNNGAGKSSIIEALVYAIYGRTIRGIKTDAVVNKVAKKNMKIFLDFTDDDGVEYRIARYRKHTVNKNKSLIYRNGTDITPKSEADFNSFVADLLQMDYLTFTSSILYSAESFKFTSATDAEMKTTFDMMLGLDVFTKCLEIAKSRLKKVEDELSTSEWKIDSLNGQIERLETEISETEVSAQEYKKNKAEKIKLLQESVKSLQAELKQYVTEEEKLKKELEKKEQAVKKAEEAHKSAKKKLSQIEQLKQVVSDINSDIKDQERDIKGHERDIQRYQGTQAQQKEDIVELEEKIETFQQKKEKLDEDIGQPCPTCGQPITKESLEPAKAEYDHKIEKARKGIDEHKKSIEESDEKIKELEQLIEELQQSVKDNKKDRQNYEKLIEKSQNLVDEEQVLSEAVDKAKEDFAYAKSDVSVIAVKIESVETNLKKADNDLQSEQEDTNPYEDMIEKYQKDQKKCQEGIAEIQAGVQDKIDEKDCLLFWQQAYSNQGIKSFILDDITPFLNKRVNKYLKKLASNHIEVIFSTQTQLKSGEMREKFSIEINNEDGGSEYIANSSGERRRIDLAVNLALQDLVATRSSKKVNIAIFDEAFDALDNIGVERVIELLQELSEEKSSIFVISHNEHLKSYFTNIITVVKKGGCATLGDKDQDESEMEE